MKFRLLIAAFMCLHVASLTNFNLNEYSKKSIQQTDESNVSNNYRIENVIDEKELTKYYIDNKIFPSSIPDEVGEKMFFDKVEPHLISRFGGDSWSVESSRHVSDKYGVNPSEVSAKDDDIRAAKFAANVTKPSIGCGPLALFCQLDYLVHGPKYHELGCDIDSSFYRRKLAKEVFETVDTISLEDNLGEFIDVPKGTFTFPSSFIDGANKILERHQLAFIQDRVTEDGKVEHYYDDQSQIIVSGDIIPNMSLFNTKISNIKDSINRGMPVVWWTFGDAGDFKDHYMNIFGYEIWKSDINGVTKEHLMFKLRMNWGFDDVYMDSDTLDAVNGGFIFFKEVRKHIDLSGEDYGFDCSYNNSVLEKNIYKNGFNILTKRLRTGYVNHYTDNVLDDRRLTLSSKRGDYTNAYLRWEFDRPIRQFTICMSKWSSKEWDTFGEQIKIHYENYMGRFTIDIDSDDITNIYQYSDVFTYTFDVDMKINAMELNVLSKKGGNDRNKGRISIAKVSVTYLDLI